jgi:eukaryotic-like serine/threonine-protein kinase
MFPQIFGKYVLEREIAAGGMARVLLATLRGAGGFEKRLVVKQIRPELASDQSFIGRFVAEAKTAVELSHANIVPVYELGVEQGTYYIAMEFCQGVALSQLLVQGALSPAEGAYIGVEICRALDYAHRKAGIVHRDVTPRNVMIDPEGMVRLIDFGIAAPVDPVSVDPSGDRAREPLFGSAGHMPPEQLRHGPLTAAADVFAVGALLVEAWSGKPPFRRESFEASVRALREPVPDLSQIDLALTSLAPLLKAALALEPSARPQTAEEVARPLREFLRQSDLGDIARRLGDRVSARLTRPPDPPRASARDPSLRATGAGATQTFAARDALLEWTAKIDSQPPAAPAASAISGVVIESGSLPSESRSGVGRGGGASAARRRWLAALSGLTVLALSALWLAQRGASPPLPLPNPERARDPVLATQPGRAAEPVPPAPVAVAALPAEVPTVAVPAHPPQEPARSPRAPARAMPLAESRKAGAETSAPASSSHPRALVQVTAEPRALVLIDGVAAGRTPLSLSSLTPGQHSFVFTSELMGEKLETKLSVRDGDRQRVHADFTSATPQVYLR